MVHINEEVNIDVHPPFIGRVISFGENFMRGQVLVGKENRQGFLVSTQWVKEELLSPIPNDEEHL